MIADNLVPNLLDSVKAELDELDRIEKCKPRQKDLSHPEIYSRILNFFKVGSVYDIPNLSPLLIAPFCNEDVEAKSFLRILKGMQDRIDNPPKPKKKRKSSSRLMPRKDTNYAEGVINRGHINCYF